MNNSKRQSGMKSLMKLSIYLDELGEKSGAKLFKKFALELKDESPRSRLRELSRQILESLHHGPGRIPDLYFAKPDGQPHVARSEEYLATIQEVRRFARRAAPPFSYFIL